MPRLDLGREIVAEIIRTGTPRPYIDAGMTREWLDDRFDLDHVTVFPPQDAEAYQTILQHWEQHGVVPTAELFRTGFPEASYRLPANDHTASELIELATAERQDFAAQEALDDLQKMVDIGEFQSIAARAERLAQCMTTLQGTVATRSFRLLALDDLDGLPDPEPLIEGILDHGTVTMLAGASGSGKSFVALDWALSIASGRAWHGREARQGKVLYLAAEGAYGMKQRVRAWREQHGPAGDFDLIPDAVQLSEALPLAQLVQVAKDYQFIVIDTLARTSAGLEENSARDMGKYVNALYQLRDALQEAGATVLVVHHTGYDRSRARGSSAIHANVDNVLTLEAPEDPHQYMELKFSKRKDGPAGAPVVLQLVPAGPSCYVVELEQPPAVPARAEDKILTVLTGDGMTQDEIMSATGLSRSAVSGALKQLLCEKAVTKDGNRSATYRPA